MSQPDLNPRAALPFANPYQDEIDRVMGGQRISSIGNRGNGGEWDALRHVPPKTMQRLTGGQYFRRSGLSPEVAADIIAQHVRNIHCTDDAIDWYVDMAVRALDCAKENRYSSRPPLSTGQHRHRHTIVFTGVFTTAQAEVKARWNLIDAIADDATRLGMPISGMDTVLAARAALEEAGVEMTLGTVRNLCATAKFYDDANLEQRDVFTSYGWTIVRDLAKAGWSTDDAADFLGDERRTRAAVTNAIKSRDPGVPTEVGVVDEVPPRPVRPPTTDLSELWGEWLNQMSTVLLKGARLMERTEAEHAVDVYGHLGCIIYQRFSERRLDAEYQHLLDQEAGHAT
jgi:hypothetical protein